MSKPRDPIVCLVTLACGFASLISAAPAITSVQNAASNIVGLPNAAIAFGSIFVLKGSGLGPPNISISSKPFQATTLSGTSVTITFVDGKTVGALMYYTSDKQIAALLPS